MANYDSDKNAVMQVQLSINVMGYTPSLMVDGIYGPATEAAVKWFQGKHGLTQDGIIGDQTMAATIAALPNAAPSATKPLVPPVTTLASPKLPANQRPIHLVGASVVNQATKATPGAASSMMPFIPTIAAASAAPGSTFVVASTAVVPATKKTWLGILLPAGLAVAGAAGGFFAPLAAIAVPVRVAGGAVIGLLMGAAVVELTKPKATATMHGESVFGMDVNFDDTDGTIMAGEIGCASPVQTVRG